MSHYANGVDRNGMLTFDIIIRGEVPDLGPIKSVYLAPYTEQYIQTGPGECSTSRLGPGDTSRPGQVSAVHPDWARWVHPDWAR